MNKIYPFLLALSAALILSVSLAFNTSRSIKPAESFWTIVQDENKVWWFKSPDGKLEFMTNVQNIQPVQKSIDPFGRDYVSSDFTGDMDEWAKKTAARVLEYGFKGSGAWRNKAIHSYLHYKKDLNLIHYSNKSIDHPEWEADIEKAIQSLVVPLRNDQNLIGYYPDNELDWKKIEPHAEKYFSTVYRLIRKYDPNHLILGVRFRHRVPLSVLYAAKGHVDALSFNSYTDEAILWKNNVSEMYEITGRPLIITEFSFYSNENQSGNLNTKNFGGLVNSQEDRASSYKRLVTGAAKTSYIIGADWFQYNDEPIAGRKSDGEDINFGVVDIYDMPYEDLISTIQKVNSKINETHKTSDTTQLDPVWRDDLKRPLH